MNPDKLNKDEGSFAAKLIKPFKSIKFSFILILILALLALIGIILPQVPAELAADPSGYTWWLDNVAYDRFGFWADIIGFLGLFNIFHSFWFITVIALLLFNIVMCTIGRFGKLKERLTETKAIQSEDFYGRGEYHIEYTGIKLPAKKAVQAILKVMGQHRYTVSRKEKKGVNFLSGDKNRFSVLSTYAVHFSIFLFVIGFLLTGYLGFRNTSFIVAENNIKEIGYNTGLSLLLESFTDEYWADGTPKDYRSQVTIFENGKEVKRGIIRVNHPLSYKGIRFHQMFFGPAVRIRIEDSGGALLFEGSVPLAGTRISRPYQRPEGGFDLSGTGYSVVILGSAVNETDPSISWNEIGLELYDSDMTPIAWAKLEQWIPQELEGIKFTFLENTKYSGLQVSRDPGRIFIWTASFLFLAGLGTVFYFPRRRFWINISNDMSGRTRILVKLSLYKGPGAGTEFLKFSKDLEAELDIKKGNKK